MAPKRVLRRYAVVPTPARRRGGVGGPLSVAGIAVSRRHRRIWEQPYKAVAVSSFVLVQDVLRGPTPGPSSG